MKPALLYYIEQLSKRTVETLDPWLGELEWQVNKLTSRVFVFFTALQVGQGPEEFGIITLIYNAVSCCWNEIDLSAKLKPPIFGSFAHTPVTGPWAKFKAKRLAGSPPATSLPHCTAFTGFGIGGWRRAGFSSPGLLCTSSQLFLSNDMPSPCGIPHGKNHKTGT